MKNLLNYGVQELDTKEKVEIGGGWSHTYYRDGHRYVDQVRWNNGHKEVYSRTIDGKKVKIIAA